MATLNNLDLERRVREIMTMIKNTEKISSDARRQDVRYFEIYDALRDLVRDASK